MFRRLFHAVVALGLVLGAMAAAPIVSAGDPCFHSMSRPAPTTGSVVEIGIDECVFEPTVTYVPVGAEVTWVNKSRQAHEVVGANVAWGAHKKLLHPSDSVGWTFDEPGVYAYSCMLHPGMTGALVVGDGVAPAPAAAAAAHPPAEPADAGASASGAADVAVPVALAAGTLASLVAIAVLLLRRSRHPSAA